MRRHVLIGTALLLSTAATWSAAQSAYPTHPVRVIVPFPAGGTMDTVVRLLGPEMSKTLGQPVVVENKPGAGTVLGVDAAAKSPPDGYTLVGIGNSFTVNQTLLPSLPYDSQRDLRPISLLTRTPNVLVASPNVPVKNLAELIAYAKANPGKLTYGSVGNGTIQHLAGETLKASAGINLVHVPYKGQAPALTDLLGGQIDLMFGNLPDLLPQIRAGKLKSIGVATLERAEFAPDLVTIAEQGFPGFESYAWFGLLAPAAVPEAIAARLNREVVQHLKSPALQKALRERGFEPIPSSAEEFARFMRSEVAKYGKVIKDANVRVD